MEGRIKRLPPQRVDPAIPLDAWIKARTRGYMGRQKAEIDQEMFRRRHDSPYNPFDYEEP